MGKLYSKKKQSLGCQKISLVYIFTDQGYFLFMFQFATPIYPIAENGKKRDSQNLECTLRERTQIA